MSGHVRTKSGSVMSSLLSYFSNSYLLFNSFLNEGPDSLERNQNTQEVKMNVRWFTAHWASVS